MKTTLTHTIQKLRDQGYVEDFNFKGTCIECSGRQLSLFPQDFNVDQTFRFEGATDPSDAAIVYAISSEKHGLKGVLVNSYGAYADPVVAELAAKLQDAR